MDDRNINLPGPVSKAAAPSPQEAAAPTAARSTAADFIRSMFSVTTELPVFVCTLPNQRDDPTEPGERHVATRLPSHITRFVAKWDRPKRGLFFCVGTVKRNENRKKASIVQTIGLHADIDFKNLHGDPSRDDVLRQLARLRYQPSFIVFSGGGLHIYYLFAEALDTQENMTRIEAALRQLADVVGGDLQVCEVSRLMRLPGTRNTKDGAWTPVEVISDTGARFELDDLEEWLSETSPIILRKERPREVTAGESNAFLQYAREHGRKAPIDVEKRLAQMMFMGGGTTSIHQTQLAVTASLLNQGWPVDDVVELVMTATRAAAGEYGARWNWTREERAIRGMCTTWLKKRANEKKDTASRTTPPKEGDEREANQAPVADNLPIMQVHNRISALATETQSMLIDAGVPFYARSGELVRPIVRTVQAAHGNLTRTGQLRLVTATFLRDTMCRHAIWHRYDERKRKWTTTTAPMNVAETLLERDGVWGFPEILGVIATPTMRPDGTLLIKQGYDPATRLLLIEPPLMPTMPEQPTRDDALKALALLKRLVCETPFVDEVSRSVALSGLITPVVRGAFPVAPMHVASAPVAGSGKSHLCDMSAAISTGQQRMPVIAAGNEEETEKRLAGVMLTGQPLVSIDNVNGELKGDFLCQAIEQHFLDVRPLGRSNIVRIATGGVTFFATGNNIIIVGDLCRRTITSRLDAGLENPQLRQFRNDPVRDILSNRGAYIAACLTICRAYIVAGRPNLAPRLASFAGWSDTVRSALIWLGEADPVDSMAETRAEDPQRTVLSDLLHAWAQDHGVGKGSDVPLAVIMEKAMLLEKLGGYETGEFKFPELNAAVRAATLEIGANSPGAKIDQWRLGQYCKRHKGRIVDGLRLANRPSSRGGAATWWVEQVGDDG